MTTRHYYQDSYTTHFDARIIERTTHEGQSALVLDSTYFYPTGGGQPHDTGTLGEARVIDVVTRMEDKAVLHIVDTLPAADDLPAVIDWERRLDHMQQHTGQHILTQAFVQIAAAQTVSFHLGEEIVTIDLEVAQISEAQITAVEQLVNAIIYADHPVRVRYVDPAVTDGIRMRKMPDTIGTEGLRVIDVDGFDVTACGGTHVARTGAIGIIKLLKLEKNKSMTRVTFVCGRRAMRDYGEKHSTLAGLATHLSCGIPEVEAIVHKLQADLKAEMDRARKLNDRLISLSAANLIAAGEDLVHFWLVKAVQNNFTAAEARALVSQIVAEPRRVVLLGIPSDAPDGKAGLIAARSQDLGDIDMKAAFNAAATALGARGGGRPDFMQAGGFQADAEKLSAALDTARDTLLLSTRE